MFLCICAILCFFILLPSCSYDLENYEEIRKSLHTIDTLEPMKISEKIDNSQELSKNPDKEEIFQKAQTIVDNKKILSTYDLSLIDARKLALENNLSLKVEKINPEIAEKTYQAEKAKFESILSATTQFKYNEDEVGNSQSQTSFGPSIRVPNHIGGDVSIGMSYGFSRNHIGNYVMDPIHNTLRYDYFLQKSQDLGIHLNIQQPLLKNFGWEVNHASIDIAGLQVHQADARLKLATIQLLANTEKTYWDYVAAYEQVKIQVDKYKLAQQQVETAKKMVEEGVRTKVEILRAELGVARQFEAIIIAETSRRHIERSLKRYILHPNIPLNSETILIPKTAPYLEGLIFQRQTVIELAQKNRMELIENEIQQLIDKRNVLINKNATLPNLNLEFSYSALGSDSTSNNFPGGQKQPSFRKALRQIFQSELNELAVGLTLDIPLGNKAAKKRLEATLLAQQKTKENQKILYDAIQEEILNAIDTLEQNWQRILSNKMALRHAEETYKMEQIQYQYGHITTTDLLQALTSLSDAKTAELNAIIEYQKSLVDIAFATGTVLGKI